MSSSHVMVKFPTFPGTNQHGATLAGLMYTFSGGCVLLSASAELSTAGPARLSLKVPGRPWEAACRWADEGSAISYVQF